MIYLRKGQVVAGIPNMVVYEPTGFYKDGDSVICASATNPEDPVCRYEARYIAYGGMVYSISDPDQLLAEIIKIDPNSLYGKDSKQVAVDRAIETIVPQDQTAEEGPKVESTTPNILNTTASSTSPLLGGENIESTTTNIVPESISNTATTTPAVIPDNSVGTELGADAATSTPAVIGGDNGGFMGTVGETSTSSPSSVLSGSNIGLVNGDNIVTDMTTTTPNITPDIASTTESLLTEPVIDSVEEVVDATIGTAVSGGGLVQ